VAASTVFNDTSANFSVILSVIKTCWCITPPGVDGVKPISTAFVERAVNKIVAKRMNKKQQMRWNRTTVQRFLDVRTTVLNDALEDAFRHRYLGRARAETARRLQCVLKTNGEVLPIERDCGRR
jgi:hypothetical protein